MKIELLKEKLCVLENEFKILGNKLEVLAPFTHGIQFNECKSEEYYQIKRNYENIRKEINKNYDIIRELEKEDKQSNNFVNSFGEATKRDITSSTYKNQQNRLSKEIMNFIR